VLQLIREYFADLTARIAGLDQSDDLLLELLAFAEGRLLSIHPFPDFNGRVTRLFLAELLRRLDLPIVELAPASDTARQHFLEAIRAADKLNWQPLMDLWKHRIESVQ
jgi:fido (protein-threonine AMPylation protein)